MELSGEDRGPPRLADPLQLHPTTRLSRPQAPVARLTELEQRSELQHIGQSPLDHMVNGESGVLSDKQ